MPGGQTPPGPGRGQPEARIRVCRAPDNFTDTEVEVTEFKVPLSITATARVTPADSDSESGPGVSVTFATARDSIIESPSTVTGSLRVSFGHSHVTVFKNPGRPGVIVTVPLVRVSLRACGGSRGLELQRNSRLEQLHSDNSGSAAHRPSPLGPGHRD
jgi:hypothetical protein